MQIKKMVIIVIDKQVKTETQFFRCLCQTLNITLSKDEEKILSEKYDFRRNKTVNYREFCSTINKPIKEDMDSNEQSEIYQCKQQQQQQQQQPVTPTKYSTLDQVLSRLATYYNLYGLSVKRGFEDFDMHSKGTVTESQFYRNLPIPPDISEIDLKFLVQTYAEISDPGYINYSKLDVDVKRCQAAKEAAKEFPIPPQSETITKSEPEPDNPLAKIVDNIKIEAFKNGVRTTDFFRDYDKLNCGAITESQFITSLKLGIGKEAHLTMSDIQKIVEANRTLDGKVRYKEFCDDIENAFTRCHLEQRPTEEVTRPPMGALNRRINILSTEEEAEIKELLDYQSEKIRERNLLLFPYFKDYDRGVGYTKSITKNQFARVMHFVQLELTDRQLRLLVKKFGNENGDINYPLYVQTVDPDFKAHFIGDVILPDQAKVEVKKAERSNLTFDEVMARIRHVVFVNRLQVGQNFEDYDPLKSGSITKAQFRRGLSSLGFSKIGFHDMTNDQFDLLCDHYQDPHHKDKIIWTNFNNDINLVFTKSNLEKTPMEEIPPSEVYLIPKSGTADWSKASDEQKAVFEAGMKKLRKCVKEKRMLIEPCFRDFDHHSNHHITRKQFQQCLSIMNLPFTKAEIDAIEARFSNDIGFNYMTFLYELLSDEYQLCPPRYPTLKKEVFHLSRNKSLQESDANVHEEDVLTKIKNKVFKERFRLIDYMKDYDKLNSGRIIKSNFQRALGLSPLNLSGSEITLLESRFESPSNPGSVDYRKFCDEIESVFTTANLDKSPLKEVEQYRPKQEWETNILKEEEESEFMKAMTRIAEKVRQVRLQLFPLMEDYDKNNIGSLSRSQFRRVLVELELGSYFTERELEIICKKFKVRVGSRDDVHYIAFCDFIYELAKFIYRTP
ncbi:Hypothetical predicted protein [Octopus vulgaris]|uniref:EF-hand calcium-binding domain-containing protein 6-like n=1 Tax=Octopus vulgaris TaxID=6645 RepID=A0AA36F5B9_OCTVU|nr:Hypothetical predicted protein [Octopus vulgaris]